MAGGGAKRHCQPPASPLRSCALPVRSSSEQELVAKPWRLAPNEVRVLRGMVGPRAEDLARELAVSVGQISRWETGAKPISSLADRLLRALVAAQYELPLPVDVFGNLDDSRVAPLALRLKLGKAWKVVERGAGAVS